MDEIAQQCLDAHNAYRRKHGAPPLKISDSLMSMAQNWAETNANDGNMYHSKNRGNIGENLYSAYPSIEDGKVAVDNWYDEIKNYNWNRPGTGSGVIGHFTQVVWKGSRELGVGMAAGSDGWVYFCCNYEPAGNMMGDYDGNVLPPGTACDEPEESNEPEAEEEAPGEEEEEAPAEEEEEPPAEEEEAEEASAEEEDEYQYEY